ncbi:hypothetical protein PybrP1_004503 [[Pythium] brassicae (nom. inval.)]|nr:hypothetical protein PybrP1_004503 [[Pythium] brassicae (nom. inval.)]
MSSSGSESSSSASSGGDSDTDAPRAASPPPPPPPPAEPTDLSGSLELAQVAHFCASFRAPLKLSRFSRTELQAALLDAANPDERQLALLAEVHFKLTRDQTGVKLERMIQDWEKAVARKLAENWQLEFASNPMASASYAELSVYDRIRVLNALCLWKAESCADIRKHIATLQKDDAKAFGKLRGSEIGTDDAGVSYWYFDDDCWVYAEDKPLWQREQREPLYITEFANGKRIRLSINFQASDADASPRVSADTTSDVVMADAVGSCEQEQQREVKKEEATCASGMAAAIDEKAPVKEDPSLKEGRKAEAAPPAEDAGGRAPPPTPAVETTVKDEVRPVSRKMDINMICGSPASDDTSVKSEPEKSASLLLDTNGASISNGAVKVKDEKPANAPGSGDPSRVRADSPRVAATDKRDSSTQLQEPKGDDKKGVKSERHRKGAAATAAAAGGSATKKRFIIDDDNTDSSDSGSERKTAKKAAHAPEKRISFASSPQAKRQKTDATTAVAASASAVVVVVEMPTPATSSESVAPPSATGGGNDTTSSTTTLSSATSGSNDAASNGAPADENFDINCECCQKDYDMRYLDPPLVERPAGEWRCFECLVNDARGWPRRRKPTASPTASAEPVAAEEKGKSAAKKSSGATSSATKRSRPSSSKSSSSKAGGASSHSNKRKKSSGHSASASKKSSSSSSSKKHKKKKKSSSSASSHHSHRRHHRSSSSSHHRRRHHHEYSKLLAAFQARNTARVAVETYRLEEASRCDAGFLEGPTSWRVVSSSVDSLRALAESLTGGSLEQERLRSRLISILKVQEKLDEERRKRQELAWQVLPRRQSSRIAIGKMRNQSSSGSERSDDALSDDGDNDDGGGGVGRKRIQRSGRARSSDSAHAADDDSKQQLALDRASRARRRQHIVDTDEHNSGDEDKPVMGEVVTLGNWINWSVLKGNKRSLSTMCLAAVDRLLKEEISDLFSRPVDPEFDGCPDYLTIITSPMDLGTIRTRLQSGSYKKWEAFKADVDLVWSNCRAFNGTDMMISQYADTLDALFQQMCVVAEKRGADAMADSSDDSRDDDDDGGGGNSSSAESRAESKTSVNKEWTESSESESSGSSDASASSSDNRGKARSSRSTQATGRAKPTRSSPSGAASASARASRSRGGRTGAKKTRGSSESEASSSDASGDSDAVRRPTKRKATAPARATRASSGRLTATTPPKKSRGPSSASPRAPARTKPPKPNDDVPGSPPPPPPPAHVPASLEPSASGKSPRAFAVPRTARLRVSDGSSSDDSDKASSSSSSSSSSSDDSSDDSDSDVDLRSPPPPRRKASTGAPTPTPPSSKKPAPPSDRAARQAPPPPPPPPSSPPNSTTMTSPGSAPSPPPPPPPPSDTGKTPKAAARGGATAGHASKKAPSRPAPLKLNRVGDSGHVNSPTLLSSYPSPSSSSSSYFSSSADSDSSDSSESGAASE